MMAGINIRTGWISTISDQPEEIIHALAQAGKRADIIIATGGLGPTPDDLTKKALATFFKTELVLHQETLDRIKHIFEGRGMIMPDTNKSQAMLPASAKIIPNKFGTAPGLEFRQDDRVYFFLPGVPHEMKSLISDYVLDSVKHMYFPPARDFHIFRTNGLPESKLYETIQNLLDRAGGDYEIAFLPKSSGVDIRIKSNPGQKISPDFLQQIRKLLKTSIYSENEQTLPEILAHTLIRAKLSLALAESFTGGAISDWISDIPGCSAYYLGSVISYSNQSKIQHLGVSEKTLDKHGAVSDATAREMAMGVQERFSSDCAIASTGIAGPSGATPGKPVGLCYLAACVHDRVEIRKYNFGNDRRINKERGAAAGLALLLRILTDNLE
jgi:nicotinamide-nucleotide amidase